LPLPFKIAKHDIVEIDGVAHRLDQQTGGGLLLLTNLESGNPYQVDELGRGTPGLLSISRFLEMMRDKRIVIRREPLPSRARQAARAAQRDHDDIRTLDTRVDARASVTRHMDANKVPKSDIPIEAALDVLCTPEWITEYGPRPGASTVRLWMSTRGRPGDRRLRDFMSLSGRTLRRKRLHPTVEAIFYHHECDHFTNQGLSVQESYDCACADITRASRGETTSFGDTFPMPETPHKWPTYESFRRRVSERLKADTFAAKYGARAKNSRWRGAGQPLRATRPLELVTIDTWEMPGYFCIDPQREIPLGKVYITTAQDVATKAIVGKVIECSPPSSATIAKLLVDIGSVKAVPPIYAHRYPGLAVLGGKPATILMDNALYQISRSVEDMAADADIEIRYAGADEPRHKAPHERSFRSLKTYAVDKLPGATFDVPRMREFGFDPAEHKLVTFNEIVAVFDEIIAFYNTQEHRGLSKRQPLCVWETLIVKHKPDVFADFDEFEKAIGDVRYDLVLQKSGLEIAGIRYCGYDAVAGLLDDLAGKQNRKTKNATALVKVKVNRDDLGQVRVWNDVRKTYVVLEADDPEYAKGMPLWLHERVQEFARAQALAFRTPEERVFARERLVRIIREISPEASARERRTLAMLGHVPAVRELVGDHVVVEREAAPREGIKDGVPNVMAASTRIDATAVPPRSARGRDPNEYRDPRDAGSPTKPTKSKARDRRGETAPKPAKSRRSGEADWADYA
jgi:putative transposase